MQYIQQAGKSGELVIQGARGSGHLEMRGGRVASSRWKDLRGRDAVLAMLDSKEGQFRLTTEEAAGEAPAGAGSFTIQEVLMEAAWIEDQLGRRRQHLPATGEPLQLLKGGLPAIEEELESLPFEQIYSHLQANPGARLYDLIHRTAQAPPKVRLTVAYLAEQGVVAPEESLPDEIMSTVEISSSMVLDLAVHNLLSSARDAGLDISALSYLVLVEPGVQAQLVDLLESERGFRSIAALCQLGRAAQAAPGRQRRFRHRFRDSLPPRPGAVRGGPVADRDHRAGLRRGRDVARRGPGAGGDRACDREARLRGRYRRDRRPFPHIS